MREKWETLSLAVLKDIAKGIGVKGYSTMKKDELITILDAKEAENEKQKAAAAPAAPAAEKSAEKESKAEPAAKMDAKPENKEPLITNNNANDNAMSFFIIIPSRITGRHLTIDFLTIDYYIIRIYKINEKFLMLCKLCLTDSVTEIKNAAEELTSAAVISGYQNLKSL